MSSITYNGLFLHAVSYVAENCWNVGSYKSVPSGYSRTISSSMTQTGGKGDPLTATVTFQWPDTIGRLAVENIFRNEYMTYFGRDISEDYTVITAKEALHFISAFCYTLTKYVVLVHAYVSSANITVTQPFFLRSPRTIPSTVCGSYNKYMENIDVWSQESEPLRGMEFGGTFDGNISVATVAKCPYYAPTLSLTSSCSSSSCSSSCSSSSSSCSCSSIFVAYFNI